MERIQTEKLPARHVVVTGLPLSPCMGVLAAVKDMRLHFAVVLVLSLARGVSSWCSNHDRGDCFIQVRAGGTPSDSTAHARGISFLHRPHDTHPDEESFAHIAAVPNAGQGRSELRFALGSDVHARLHESGLLSTSKLKVGGTINTDESAVPFVLKVVGDGGLMISAADEAKAWSVTSSSKPRGLVISEGDTRVLRLSTGAPKDSMVLSEDGNLGIGTAWPTVKLDVNGGVQGTSAYSSASDARFKSNIQELSANECLAKVSHMRPVSFVWRQQAFPEKNFDHGEQIGFIAQEMEKIVPQIVSVDSRGFRAVKYASLTPLLVGAVAQLSQQIKDLQNIARNLDLQ